MDRIAQEAYYRQRVVRYGQRKGATAAADRYHISRKTVWKWSKAYDGTVESLYERSRRPHHSPKAQTHGELELVKRYARKYRKDLLLGYEKARRYGYCRSYGCFKRTARKLLGDTEKSTLNASLNPMSEQLIPVRRCSLM